MKLTIGEATNFFSILFFGEHHIPGKIKKFGFGFCINCGIDMSTFDYNYLTRFVFLAHDLCYRGSILPSGPGMIKITIWKRKRKGAFTQRHPTLYNAWEEWEKEKKKYNIKEVT